MRLAKESEKKCTIQNNQEKNTHSEPPTQTKIKQNNFMS